MVSNSNINMLLKITGLFDHSPLTFLLDSGAAVSVVHVCLSALISESRNRITTAGLLESMVPHWIWWE